MIFADTGYFIALLDSRDSLHSRALDWSRSIKEPTLLTEYVVVEIFNSFSQPFGRMRAYDLFQRISVHDDCLIIPASPLLLNAGIELYVARPDKEWSLTDCISFAVMKERGISRALAYDHHFEQAGFEALLRSAVYQ